MPRSEATQPFVGITVLGDFILSEGVESVLANALAAGATAVACNPTVTAAADATTGSFQPPPDAGSSPRVFDRPLFGQRSLWVRSGVSFRPRQELYRNSPYGPRQPNDLTQAHGTIIGEFIEKAVANGLKVYLQVGAAQPTQLRDEDRPFRPDGSVPSNRMADTASLASEAVRADNRAYVQDLLTEYPEVTGFRPDWPEYPCYTLDEVFQDFSPHAKNWAERHGFDFGRMLADVGSLYDWLEGSLCNRSLEDFATPDRGKYSILTWLNRFPGIAEWLRFKSALSVDLLRHWREAVSDAAGEKKELAANAFMPPYSLLTGFDFSGAAGLCDAVAPKLYTMHWSLMVKFWADAILQRNPQLDESLLVRALVNLMDLADSGGGRCVADYGYPEPHEPHPIPNEPQLRKIHQVTAAVAGKCAVYPLVHGYGPADDFRRRLQLVADSGAAGVWINRYGYLSDEKLQSVAAVDWTIKR